MASKVKKIQKELTKKQFQSLTPKQFDALSNDDMIKYMLKFKLITMDELMGRRRGGMMKKVKAYAMGGLKDVPAENKGLGKLPTSVRNKMGYKKDGGMTMKHTKKTKGYAKGGMKKTKGYAKGGMKKPKMMGGGMNMKGKKTKGYARGGKR